MSNYNVILKVFASFTYYTRCNHATPATLHVLESYLHFAWDIRIFFQVRCLICLWRPEASGLARIHSILPASHVENNVYFYQTMRQQCRASFKAVHFISQKSSNRVRWLVDKKKKNQNIHITICWASYAIELLTGSGTNFPSATSSDFIR